ncbi:MAG TPA: hypothetical protein DIT25_02135 [Candidatus Moranbacteria bacterium]|nr:hypothetical protein [Candidatus Moranbacteria bacterium]
MQNISQEEKEERADRLRTIRRGLPKKSSAKAGAIAESLSLMHFYNPWMDWLYGIALSLALMKDILDFVGFGSLPLLGTAVTLVVSFSIFFIMLITGSFSQAKWAKRVGVLTAGTLAESLFGINFLPVETIIVVIVFRMTLQARQKKAAESAGGRPPYATEAFA